MSQTEIALDSLSIEELEALKIRIDGAIAKRRQQLKSQLAAEFEERAKSLGLKLDDIVGGHHGKRKPTGKPGAPMFRDPKNAAATWSGRGRRPQWFIDRLNEGVAADAMRIAD